MAQHSPRAGARSSAVKRFRSVPVAGLVTQFRGINVFAEGAYMWRNFKSVEWDGETATNIPHSLDFTGASLSIGLQFEFKTADK